MLAPISFIGFLVALMVLCGRWIAKFAAQRGRSNSAWFLWGALFFPLFPVPTIIPVLLPRRSQENAV